MTKITQISTRWLALILVVVPMTLATLFYAFMASDRYVSRTVISVRDISSGGSVSSSGGLSSLLGGAVSPAFSDLMYLQSYVFSMDLLKRLDARLKLREHYSASGSDLLFRLPADATDEEFLAYFRRRIEMTHDDIAGLLAFNVQAFDKTMAQRTTQAMVEESERFVNDYMHRISREKMGFAESEVERAMAQVQKAKAEVLSFQTRNKLLDPLSQASANSSLVATLQASMAQKEAELRAAQAYLSDDTYQVKSLRSQLAALQSQLETERQRATTSKSGTQLASLSIEFQSLQTRAVFAEEGYKSAVLMLEQARLDSMRKLKTVVVVEPPTQPQEALYPRRIYDLLTLLVGCTMLLAVVKLILVTIREHQD